MSKKSVAPTAAVPQGIPLDRLRITWQQQDINGRWEEHELRGDRLRVLIAAHGAEFCQPDRADNEVVEITLYLEALSDLLHVLSQSTDSDGSGDPNAYWLLSRLTSSIGARYRAEHERDRFKTLKVELASAAKAGAA